MFKYYVLHVCGCNSMSYSRTAVRFVLLQDRNINLLFRIRCLGLKNCILMFTEYQNAVEIYRNCVIYWLMNEIVNKYKIKYCLAQEKLSCVVQKEHITHLSLYVLVQTCMVTCSLLISTLCLDMQDISQDTDTKTHTKL
jgi:hypothetical protein